MAPASPAVEAIARRMLFLFLDGVGRGEDDPERNPFAAADMRTMVDLLEGREHLLQPRPGKALDVELLDIPTASDPGESLSPGN